MALVDGSEVLRDPVDLHLVEPEFEIPEVEGAREADKIQVVHPPLAYLNTMGQQRGSLNARQSELTESIRAEGLHYPIDITVLDEPTLKEYIDFTNKVWLTDKSIEEFVPFETGQFLVVIAGHSRLIAKHTIAEDDDTDKMDVGVKCQLHVVDSVEQFIAIQLRENIHSSPPAERAARAYAEAFIYAKVNNPELSYKEFAKAHGIRQSHLRDALHYVELPASMRALTDSGELKFSIAVELAKALRWIQKETEASLHASGIAGEEYDRELVDRVNTALLRYVAMHTSQHNGHVTNTKKRIRHDVAQIKKDLGADTEVDVPTEDGFEFALFDARSLDADSQHLRAESQHFNRTYASRHGVAVTGLHNAVAALTEQPELEIDIDADLALAELAPHVTKAAEHASLFGKTALEGSEEPTPQS